MSIILLSTFPNLFDLGVSLGCVELCFVSQSENIIGVLSPFTFINVLERRPQFCHIVFM